MHVIISSRAKVFTACVSRYERAARASTSVVELLLIFAAFLEVQETEFKHMPRGPRRPDIANRHVPPDAASIL